MVSINCWISIKFFCNSLKIVWYLLFTLHISVPVSRYNDFIFSLVIRVILFVSANPSRLIFITFIYFKFHFLEPLTYINNTLPSVRKHWIGLIYLLNIIIKYLDFIKMNLILY